MSISLESLSPQILWKNFKAICQIPHPSKHEKAMTEFVKKFGENLGLETAVDEVGNVLIRKPATPGMEHQKGVILQSHLDMVPQKESHIKHDFTKDPIQAYVDGEWVTAKETTLGADNGIGVAAILSVLEAKDIAHPAIEALFTVDEETGMTGVFNIKPNWLKGEILLNLDTGEQENICIGCTGMQHVDITGAYSQETPRDNQSAFRLTVSGLQGGHSGANIHLGRANAIKILVRLLHKLQSLNIQLADFQGGTAVHNAIPREANAVILIPNDQIDTVKQHVAIYQEAMQRVYTAADPDLKVECVPVEMPKNVLDSDRQKKLITSLLIAPHGVIRMNGQIKDLTETSVNLAHVSIQDGNITILTSMRSDFEHELDYAALMVENIFHLMGAQTKRSGSYPGWAPNPHAPIVCLTQTLYKELFNQEPNVMSIHAGLEFGILGKTYPHLEIVSIGPDIEAAHSPSERVNIKSVEKFWTLLKAILKNIPAAC